MVPREKSGGAAHSPGNRKPFAQLAPLSRGAIICACQGNVHAIHDCFGELLFAPLS